MLGGVLLARLGRGSLLGRDLEPAGERGVHLVREELLRPLLALLLEDTPGGGAGGGGAGGFDLRFDETSLLPAELERGGVAEPAAILSGGMREQLALLTRLAFARLLARGAQGAAPVILDDALVWSDDDRIERMFNALHRQARDLQILVLTCRQRAFERLGGRPLRMVDWTPPEL